MNNWKATSGKLLILSADQSSKGKESQENTQLCQDAGCSSRKKPEKKISLFFGALTK